MIMSNENDDGLCRWRNSWPSCFSRCCLRLVCVRVVLLESAISYIDSILKVLACVKNFASYKEMCLRVIVLRQGKGS